MPSKKDFEEMNLIDKWEKRDLISIIVRTNRKNLVGSRVEEVEEDELKIVNYGEKYKVNQDGEVHKEGLSSFLGRSYYGDIKHWERGSLSNGGS